MNHFSTTRRFAGQLIAAAACLGLFACSTPSKRDVQFRSLFQSEPQGQKTNARLPEIITPSAGKIIAVTDIAYRQEFREFFTEEKVSSKTDTLEAAPPATPPTAAPTAPAPPATPSWQQPLPQHIPDPQPMQNRSSLERRAYLQSAFFRPAQAHEPQPNSPAPPAENAPTPGAGGSANALTGDGSRASRNEYSYLKRSGIERQLHYGELRGVAADIRGLLLKSGYRVAAARPAVEKPLQDDQYFDILARIRAGDFANADYVLFGVLSHAVLNEHNAVITGTQSNMQLHVMDLAVDFSLIDTQTGQVVASFTAVGSGREQRIDGKASGYAPNAGRMFRLASVALAEDVALQLNSQHLTLSPAVLPSPSIQGSSGGAKHRNDEDSRSLRIYR